MPVLSGGQEDPLEEGMATHSNILAWTGEPGGLQPAELQKAGHDWSDLAQHSTYHEGVSRDQV